MAGITYFDAFYEKLSQRQEHPYITMNILKKILVFSHLMVYYEFIENI
jgi:hypothetical protein